MLMTVSSNQKTDRLDCPIKIRNYEITAEYGKFMASWLESQLPLISQGRTDASTIEKAGSHTKIEETLGNCLVEQDGPGQSHRLRLASDAKLPHQSLRSGDMLFYSSRPKHRFCVAAFFCPFDNFVPIGQPMLEALWNTTYRNVIHGSLIQEQKHLRARAIMI